jgi:hypothetical protein
MPLTTSSVPMPLNSAISRCAFADQTIGVNPNIWWPMVTLVSDASWRRRA